MFLIRRQNEIRIERKKAGRHTCHSDRAETVVVMRNKPQEAEIDFVKVYVRITCGKRLMRLRMGEYGGKKEGRKKVKQIHNI